MPGAAATTAAAAAAAARGHRRCHARQGTQEFGSAEDSDVEEGGLLAGRDDDGSDATVADG